jgi:hypothetical protein
MDKRDLAKAARFERERRGETYPQKIFNGGDKEALCIDYQCWVAIETWLELDTFSSFHGGADPERDDAPIISWPHLEAAAKKALHAMERKLAGEGWFDGCPETETSRRRCALVHIHRKLQLRRESIDIINAEFRKRRETEAA